MIRHLSALLLGCDPKIKQPYMRVDVIDHYDGLCVDGVVDAIHRSRFLLRQDIRFRGFRLLIVALSFTNRISSAEMEV